MSGPRVFTYLSWLEARAAEHGEKINEEAMEALRRGWYWGEKGFKDKLLALFDKAKDRISSKSSHAGEAVREHGRSEAERIVSVLAKELGLPTKPEELMQLRKSDSRKVVCAALIKSRTAVANDWIAQRLAMGHPASMSQLVNRLRRNPKPPGNCKSMRK